MPLPSLAPSPAFSLLPRLRRRAAVAFTAAVVFGAHLAPAFAQDEPPDDGDDAVEIVGWDLSDPVNRAESREFFAGLWAAEDAGLPPPAFEFTNTPPGLMLAMLLPELEVLTEIYGHRLQLDFDAGERYLVTNLIADDAEVRAEFRAFVLTGKLAPRPEIDAGAYLAHYLLVLDAVTAQERASVVGVEALGMLLESEGLSVEAEPPAHDQPIPTNPSTQEDARTKCALLWLLSASRLACVYEKLRTAPTPGVDFDCDDAADALLRWLLRSPNPDGSRLLPPAWEAGGIGIVACRDPAPTGRGHAVPVLIDPHGRYWYLEPWLTVRSKAVQGPYPSKEALLVALRRRYLRGCNDVHPSITDDVLPMHDLGLRGHGVLGEGDPWWTNATWRARFCSALGECCEATPQNLLNCNEADWIPTPRPTFEACDIRDYMPNPLPDWLDSWGPLEPCSPAAR
jgi:hypothetical protein